MVKKSALTITLPMLLLSVGIAAAPTVAQGQQLAQSPRPTSSEPVAGQVPLGVTVIQLRAIVAGWSAKKDVLGKHVQNDHGEDLGAIEDIILTQPNEASYEIIGVGGFLGIAERLVAIPTRQLKIEGNHFVLPGATKDVLRAMPPFVYSH
jgi:hypothetical protein